MRSLLIVAALVALAFAANDFGKNNNPSAPRAPPGIARQDKANDATLVSKVFGVLCAEGEGCAPNTTIPNGLMAVAIKPRAGQSVPENIGSMATMGGRPQRPGMTRAAGMPNARITHLLFTTAHGVPSFRFGRTIVGGGMGAGAGSGPMMGSGSGSGPMGQQRGPMGGMAGSGSGPMMGGGSGPMSGGAGEGHPAGAGVGFGYRILGFVEFFDASNDGFDSSDVVVRRTLFGKAGGHWSPLAITSALDSGSTEYSTYTAVTSYSTEDNGTMADLTVSLDQQYSSRAGGKEHLGPDRFEHTLRLYKPFTTAGTRVAIIGAIRHKSRVDDNSPDASTRAANVGPTDLAITANSDAEEPLSVGFFSWEPSVTADGVAQDLLAKVWGETPPHGQDETPPSGLQAPSGLHFPSPTAGMTRPEMDEDVVFLSFTVMSSGQAAVIEWDPSTGINADETARERPEGMRRLTRGQIGGIIGGVVGFAAIVTAVIVYCCCVRRKCCRPRVPAKTVSGGEVVAPMKTVSKSVPSHDVESGLSSHVSATSSESDNPSSYA